jgi:hypothetical protein
MKLLLYDKKVVGNFLVVVNLWYREPSRVMKREMGKGVKST